MIIQNNQDIFDVCLQELGKVDRLFELLDANDMSIEDAFDDLEELVIPKLETSSKVVDYYKENGIIVF